MSPFHRSIPSKPTLTALVNALRTNLASLQELLLAQVRVFSLWEVDISAHSPVDGARDAIRVELLTVKLCVFEALALMLELVTDRAPVVWASAALAEVAILTGLGLGPSVSAGVSVTDLSDILSMGRCSPVSEDSFRRDGPFSASHDKEWTLRC